MEEKLLTTDEAAQYLTTHIGVPIRAGTLAVWRTQPKIVPLRFQKIGHLVRYRVKDLDEFTGVFMRTSKPPIARKQR